MGLGGGGTSWGVSGGAGGSDLRVSSTVECLPVVHGGIERNSSKVKKRGLQHFQPATWSQPMLVEVSHKGAPRHLSALRGIRVALDDNGSLLQGLQMSCRSLCARTFEPCLGRS